MIKKKMSLEVNSEIKKRLQQKGIPIDDGISYLLILYYKLSPSFIPQELENKILSCGILKRDYAANELIWSIKLFEESITNFEWIIEFMDLFKKVNVERRGVKSTVLKRMKKFFMNNPSIRKEDVMEATRNYLKTVYNSVYCKMSHKFIYEMDNSSMLLDFVEKLEETRNNKMIYDEDIIM